MKNIIPFEIDNDTNLGYEKRSLIYILIVPAMIILTIWVALKKKILGSKLKINTFWFDGASAKCRAVKENATTWRALDIIYNYRPGEDKSFGGRITDFWNHLNNIAALRNRLRLINKLLRENLQEFSRNTNEIRLLSVASGSAQGVIEVMKEFKDKGVIIKAIFLDLDPTAIEHSKKLSQKAGVIDQITFVNKSAKELEKVAKDFNPHIIEMVGFLEYRPHQKAIELVRRIYSLLVPNGVFITSSVSPSLESLFSYYVGDWPMFYRNLEQFVDIVTKGGFKQQDIKIIYEPLKVQKIAISRKFI